LTHSTDGFTFKTVVIKNTHYPKRKTGRNTSYFLDIKKGRAKINENKNNPKCWHVSWNQKYSISEIKQN
jgi:hypothetical protein